MKYISTRQSCGEGVGGAGFEAVLLAGLAPDGGLYMPTSWPSVSAAQIADFQGQSYGDVAASVLARFTGGDFSKTRLAEITCEAYGAFDHGEVAPLTQVGDEDWILELYHGPTLAFKDFALQVLGRLFDDALARCGARLTVVVATSGDTGAAAIDGLKGRDRIDVFVLHPEGRVSEVQRRMMTSVDDPNIYNIAVDGSFDDCQAIVKTLFADRQFVEEVSLGGVNSINWARLAAQTVYYFTACAKLADRGEINFVAPTGNFGDVFAGYTAKMMGAPIARLGVATNANDILHRALTMGAYTPSSVTPTASPSMDIQIASNFERLLYDVMNRDGAALAERMDVFAADKSLLLSKAEREMIAAYFVSHAVGQDETLEEIKRHESQTGALIDPHTAVARAAARRFRASGAMTGPIVTLSTAHPAKFPDAVKAATGKTPELPPAHAGLYDRAERMTRAHADAAAIKEIINHNARAAS